jgi:hypothetical protein
MVVLEGRGIEAEQELAYGQLNKLLRPLRDRLTLVSPTQSSLLGAIVGATASVGQVPDRFSVAVATLAPFDAASATKPLLILLDDLQWVDRPTVDALAFVARRPRAESIARLIASRSGDGSVLGDISSLCIGGLSPESVAELLSALGLTDISAQRCEFLTTATNGNPLALTELPRLLSPDELRGAVPTYEPVAVGSRIRDASQERVVELPTRTRQALLIASLLVSPAKLDEHEDDTIDEHLFVNVLSPSWSLR